MVIITLDLGKMLLGTGVWIKGQNMLEDIEALINEHCQKHPQVQEEASNILELEELSTLEEENIIEEPDDDDSVISDQLADQLTNWSLSKQLQKPES